jgi:hypothetical protein
MADRGELHIHTPGGTWMTANNLLLGRRRMEAIVAAFGMVDAELKMAFVSINAAPLFGWSDEALRAAMADANDVVQRARQLQDTIHEVCRDWRTQRGELALDVVPPKHVAPEIFRELLVAAGAASIGAPGVEDAEGKSHGEDTCAFYADERQVRAVLEHLGYDLPTEDPQEGDLP